VTYADQIATRKANAWHRAGTALARLGFVEEHERVWRGRLLVDGFDSFDVRMRLPDGFPDALPVVLLTDVTALGRRIPHVEPTGVDGGKICIAAENATLLVADRPEDLVADALTLASRTIRRGLTGENEVDFLREFQAYWRHNSAHRIASICNPSRAGGAIEVWEIAPPFPERTSLLLADTGAQAREWLRGVGRRGKRRWQERAFFLPLVRPLEVPDPGEELTVHESLEIVEAFTTQEDAEAFRRFTRVARLPYYLIFAFDGHLGGERIVVGVLLPEARRQVRRAVRAGWREGRAPFSRELALSLRAPARRVEVERFDSAFLVPRAGGDASLSDKHVIVVGCGAVGGAIAELLAGVGVGHLRLVDPEPLGPENIHRHVLGMAQLGESKAKALAQLLRARFPHQSVEAAECRIESLLDEEMDQLQSADALIFATGDHTLELKINDLFFDGPRRIHAWVDAFGLGGHVVVCGRSGAPGCLRCVYRDDGEYGMINRLSFLAPGQLVDRSMAGCSGTFVPFSRLDAVRTAIEATKVTVEVLRDAGESLAISWRGDDTAALAAGLKLSRRATMIQAGSVSQERGFSRPECARCGRRR